MLRSGANKATAIVFLSIGAVVQSHPFLFPMFPAISGHGVECQGEETGSLGQRGSLLRCRVQEETDSPVHAVIILYA